MVVSQAWVDSAIASAHRWRVAARLVLAFAMVIGATLGAQLCDERLLWRDGALAESAEVDVHESAFAGVHHIELGVRYRAGEGLSGGPDGEVSLWTLGALDASRPFNVRWRGSRFVSSWQLDASASRWWAIAALQLWAALVAGVLFAFARRGGRRIADLRRIAHAGLRVELPIVRVWQPWYAELLPSANVFHVRRYRVAEPVEVDAGQPGYRDPARVLRFAERTFTFRCDRHAPLVLDAAPLGHLVALRDPADAQRLVFLREGNWPFDAP